MTRLISFYIVYDDNDDYIVGDILRRVVEEEPEGCGDAKLEMVTIMMVMMVMMMVMMMMMMVDHNHDDDDGDDGNSENHGNGDRTS